jgi:hypothetical protein
MTRIAFQTLMRAAAVAFLTDYAADAQVRMQVYPARPRSIFPPTGFVDSLSERIEYTALNQRQPSAEVIVIHGLFDSKDAAEQRDAFVDGFVDWSLDRIHQAHGNTTIAVTDVDDIPNFVPDWIPPAEQKTYYATRITLEGLALTG